MRLRGGVDDLVEAVMHGIVPDESEDEMPDEQEDLPPDDAVAAVAEDAADNAAPAGPGQRRLLPKRPAAKFYCEVADETLHAGTQTTVNQAVYCALKIKVDYNIHDLAFDSMIKFAAAILPPGHFLPGYVSPDPLVLL